VSLAQKREKPISQIAVDLGLNKSVLRRWIHEAHAGKLQPVQHHGEMAGLFWVSRGIYYQWARHGVSDRKDTADAELLCLIRQIVQRHHRRYGSAGTPGTQTLHQPLLV